MRRTLLVLIAAVATGIGVWQAASINRLLAAEILWALLVITVFGLGIYRIKIGSYPRHFLRSDALGEGKRKIHQIDVVGASLTMFATVYSFILLILLADALINNTIGKLVKLFAF